MTEQPAVNDLPTPLPLADIHLPDAPDYWPLAWGWWVCLFIGLCLLIGGLWMGIRHIRQSRQQQRARKEALRRLPDFNQPDALNAINLLLRQTAMSYYPRQQVASLTGAQWLAFLDTHLPPSTQSFAALSEHWHRGIFSKQALDPQDFQHCYQQAERWLKTARLPALQRQQPTQPSTAAEERHV
ncbi:DUF4381 domain-containing protein [Photobacterium sp. TY1-4]|uniref:DUF4381 domain-containing protein n=1 Tax=Photobacterium sp. TY1-4 TaxID=2899122 RepID=UPI0021C055A7|nr:DUF4381 domain-containing protein [Photobacterium sp. TY1-4]UXI03796.1 DUF4381 domain-containing protein [Photobacterium sp. TY1-4]